MRRDSSGPDEVISGEVVKRSDSAREAAGKTPKRPEWNPKFFARFGSFILVRKGRDEGWRDAGSRLEETLGSDSRVAEVHQVEQSSEWTSLVALYAARGKEMSPEFLVDRNKFLGIRLSQALIFKISVPIKNQPKFKGVSDIPSDSYWVAWDGVVCVVAWPTTEKRPPQSGGHIVVDILRDAATKSGFGFYVQACHPGCSNLFAHPVIGVETCTAHPGTYRDAFRPYRNNNVVGHIHAEIDGESVAKRVCRDLWATMRYFTLYKNYARYAIDLERYARESIDVLLALDYARVGRMSNSMWRRVVEARTARVDRLKAAEITSSLWIVLAEVEAVKRDWLENRRILDAKTTDKGLESLFAPDKSTDDQAVLSLDLGFVRAAVEHSAVKSDSSRLILITLMGAILALSGGIVGAVIGAIIQNAK